MIGGFPSARAGSSPRIYPVLYFPRLLRSITAHNRLTLDNHSSSYSNFTVRPLSMAPPTTSLVAEYAKSNRSTCRICSQTINFNSLRLGSVTTDSRGYKATKWHHFECYPIDSGLIESAESIKGFASLKGDDQKALKKKLESVGGDQEPGKLQKARKQTREEDSKTEENEQKKHKSMPMEIGISASDIKEKYKDAILFPKWKAFQTIIFLDKDEGLQDSCKIAAFDFDGCLVNTSVKRIGADAWSLMYPSVPEKLQKLYKDGFKLVIFTNESNIERWKNRRQIAVDSKIGRLNNFIKHVEVPIQVFIACGFDQPNGTNDPFRKPKPGMWHLMEQHFNSGIRIDMDQSFYVGDAAGRKHDHSDADLKFAEAVGLKFHIPEEYFC